MNNTKGAARATRTVATANKTKGRKAPAGNVQVKRTTATGVKRVRSPRITKDRAAGKSGHNPVHTRTRKRRTPAEAAQEAYTTGVLSDIHMDFIDLQERQAHVWTKNEKMFAFGVVLTLVIFSLGFMAGRSA